MINSHKLKSYIGHKDYKVSSAVVRYFADSYSHDEEVLTLLLDNYEDGNENISEILCNADNLKVNKNNFKRVLDRCISDSKNRLIYERILINSSIDLIKNYRMELNEHLKFLKGQVEMRIHFNSLRTDELLLELKRFCNENEEKYINEINYSYGKFIAKELAQREDLNISEIASNFSREDFIDDYGGYYEGFLIYIIGEMRYEPAIKLLIPMLDSEGDFFNVEAAKALSKIGGDEIIERITDDFDSYSWDFKLFAIDVLRAVKSEVSYIMNTGLFNDEEDIFIKTKLASNLCNMFGLYEEEKIRELVFQGEYDKLCEDLDRDLYVDYVINGYNFKNAEKWMNELQELRNIGEFRSRKIGRNEPCICGSGKKYKKCCGK